MARHTAMGFDLSAIQIIIVLVIALLVFGPKRLPDLAKQIGQGLRELKSQVSEVKEGVRETKEAARMPEIEVAQAISGPAAAEPTDDDLLDGVVVSGTDGPPPPPPRA